MDEYQTTIQYVAFAVTTGAAVFLQHMAFRTPNWQRQELVRRAVGIVTVLGLYGLWMLPSGAGDVLTWLGIVAGFFVAGAVKAAFTWYDEQRQRALTRDGTSQD